MAYRQIFLAPLLLFLRNFGEPMNTLFPEPALGLRPAAMPILGEPARPVNGTALIVCLSWLF